MKFVLVDRSGHCWVKKGGIFMRTPSPEEAARRGRLIRAWAKEIKSSSAKIRGRFVGGVDVRELFGASIQGARSLREFPKPSPGRPASRAEPEVVLGQKGPSSNDEVNSPSHYKQGKIEVIDFLEDQKLNFHLGNVVKYICRAPHKGSVLTDLRKARWYLDRQIAILEKVK